jgi:flagellar assembly protein FliH
MARIIKTVTAEMCPSVPFAFDDLEAEACASIEVARRRAAEIVARAEAEADALRRVAREQGQHEALSTAEKSAADQLARRLDSLLPALSQAIDEVAATKAQWLAHWERAAVKVALAIAARVIRREAAHSPEITLNLVREALELAVGRADVQLRLHPDDLAALGPHLERLQVELGRVARPQVIADPEISRGGCRVDTQCGTIDQQFETQLARIEQELV